MTRRLVAYWTTLFLLVCASLLLTGVLTGCDLFSRGGEGGVFDVPPERLAAMTAVYGETVEGGRPVQRLVVADVQNPSSYDVLSKAGNYAERPCFGPEKKRLLFEDYKGALTASDGVITLLDLDSGEVRPLVDSTEGGRRPLQGKLRGCVWSADGSGFYYTAHTFGGYAYPAYYDLENKEKHSFLPQEEPSHTVFPVARKGRDTLIVYSSKELTAECRDEGCRLDPFYFMSPQGRYLSHITNPHLELVNQGGINRKVAYSPAWNDEQALFALAYHDSTFSGYKIAVTNRGGSYYRTHTSGAYIDDHPRWGPNGQSVLFDRRGKQEHKDTAYQVMILDLKSENVREFVAPNKIDGAVALRLPDY